MLERPVPPGVNARPKQRQGLHHPGDQPDKYQVEKFNLPRRSSESESGRKLSIFKRVFVWSCSPEGLVAPSCAPGSTRRPFSGFVKRAFGSCRAKPYGRCVPADTELQSDWRCGPGFRDSPNESMVNGKKSGETSLIIWDDGAAGNSSCNVRASTAGSGQQHGIDCARAATELPGQPLKP